MRSSLTVTRVIGTCLTVAVPFAHALSPRTAISDSYDFVIVGGGQAGLVVGARLSENSNYTVLVLESGGNGDEYRERIDTPAYAYFDSLWTTPLNWGYYTVPQPNANDREIYWPRGKVLGGSSAINGLYMTRPGEIEINAWKDMLGDMDGADNWGWDSFYAAMKKSENFTAPSDSIAQEANITWNTAHHGTQGPIHASYPGFTFSQVGQWEESLVNMGIAASSDMYGGQPWGAEVSTSCINPTNWTRSYSRTGYLDPLADNGNYDVLANAHVTRIIFDNSTSGNLTANAVEYTTNNGTTKLTVKVKKEVILTAGTIGSPAVLLHSGVGPKDVLSSAGVDLVSELPGVGQHLQDHLSATVTWTTNVETAGSIFYDNGSERNNPLFLTYIDDAVAYVNATGMYGSKVDSFKTSILSQIDQYKPNTTYDSGVVDGYTAICNTTATTIFDSPIGQIELLFMNSDGNGDVGITAALQHPYSHGRIYINSSDPMDYPVIDPNYLYNPIDHEILREGLKLARQLGETAPVSSTLTNETSPGSSVQTDDEWLDWIIKSAGTEYHPSSSCAMLPRDQGGVVDANLLVYGLTNVRVADASVPPISLSTHLMASTYGVAEQASNIIRKYYDGAQATTTPSFSSTSNTTSSAVSSKHSNGSAHRSGNTVSILAWIPSVLTLVFSC
ncbi:CAZyme family AA3 [Penicillium cataractarum]|uniref:glucose oxidase n=1 Tax=Penicillium cataractarum TaxID=2100454 RepID=A0A9W9S3D3_9EURO|nr:CAZyme family AA3 [Penicillium cataractarum]KAJ5371298.1 CAZyme family AA3 [Penicillium cataractarum]